MLAAHPAERVRGRPGLRMAERITARSFDRLADLVRALHLRRPERAHLVEERALEHDEVGDPDDRLLGDRVDGAELLGDPFVHLGRRDETADARRDGEDPRRGGSRVDRQRVEQILKVGDRRARFDLQAARLAFDAAAYISTYRFADAVHEWSSRIARARSADHGSPSAR